jgi:TonB family protein
LLETITDAARRLTGASGAALAMWKDGAMVCRARSGDTAPALGARLSAEKGISGECLRSGNLQYCADTENDPLVDVEVCRSLGLRSIAVLAIQGWRGVNGVLEVFSASPAAFSEQHIAVLQQLAALAERARASQPQGASSAAPKLSSAMEKPQRTGLLPASDRVGDVALALVSKRLRPFVLGAIGLGAVSLFALAIWLGSRGPDEADGKADAATPASVSVSAATVRAATVRPSGNDPVWKANPGGESLIPLSAKPSAGAPVKFASKVDVLARKKIPADRSSLPTEVAANVTVRHEIPGSPTGTHSDETAEAQPSLPVPSAPVSRGVSGGQLLHRVEPVYSAKARLLHLEGTVILTAMVMDDGTVDDVKVVEGPPELAPSAVDAVKHWRYEPFELDGKPVKNEIGIEIDFKFPEPNQ